MASVSLIWFHMFLTVCITQVTVAWVTSEVLTHKALCLSSARIWSFGFSPNLSGKGKQTNIKCVLSMQDDLRGNRRSI